jgi:hypothetical protein
MLLGKNVAFERLGANDLTRSRFLESLGGSAIGFDFGHYSISSVDSKFYEPEIPVPAMLC